MAIDGDKFDLEDQSEVEVWTRSLGITEDELRRAVQAAGTEVGPLYDHIQRMKAASNDPMGKAA
jgi:hypothetical protein